MNKILYTFAADLYCEDCGMEICRDLISRGLIPSTMETNNCTVCGWSGAPTELKKFPDGTIDMECDYTCPNCGDERLALNPYSWDSDHFPKAASLFGGVDEHYDDRCAQCEDWLKPYCHICDEYDHGPSAHGEPLIVFDPCARRWNEVDLDFARDYAAMLSDSVAEKVKETIEEYEELARQEGYELTDGINEEFLYELTDEIRDILWDEGFILWQDADAAAWLVFNKAENE